MQYLVQISLILLAYFMKTIICQCDVKCLSCSTDGVCQQCIDGYTFNESTQTCQSNCEYNTYRDDITGTCQSVCPVSQYNSNKLLSCIEYPNCPNLIEKGQNHFDLVNAASITSKLIFVIGSLKVNTGMSKIIRVYSRDAELIGQLVGHQNNIIGIQSINSLLYSYSSTELILWDVNLGQMLRYGVFDQNLQATSLSYLDKDIIILQSGGQTFGVLQLSQFTNLASSFQSTIYVNKQINTLMGFTRFQNNFYSYSQDGKLYSYSLTQASEGVLITTVSNPIQNVLMISNNNIIILYGTNVLTSYNGKSASVVDLGHTLTINKILTDYDSVLKINYIFTFDATSFKFSYINSNNQIQLIDQRNIKKSFSKVMKGYLVTIDAYGQIILYTYSNMVLRESLTLNLSFKYYFSINDAYIGISSQQMYIFGSELLYLTLQLNRQQIVLESRNKNIPSRMVQHSSKVNGVVFDRLYNRVITYSDDGSIIFYDQIGNQYKFVMQKFYPSTSCDMLENVRCFVSVVDLQIIRPNLFTVIYSNGSIVLYKYTPLSLDMIKQLTLTDTSMSILDTYFFGSILIYCNGKEVRAYDVDQDLIILTYAPADALKFNFLHCAGDKLNGVNYLIFSRLTTTTTFTIATDTFANLAIANYVIPAAQTFGVSREMYIAQYYSSLQWYLVTNSQSQIIIGTFPNFKTGPLTISQNLPVSVALEPITRNMTVYSRNQYMTFFQWNNGKYQRQRSVQFAAYVSDRQSVAISTPELYFSFQNTGVSTIQNQVFVIRPNLSYQLVLTFVDKISSINVDTVAKKFYVGFENGNIYNGNYQENYILFSQTINYQNFYYSDESSIIFAYDKNINIIDPTLLQQNKTLSDAQMLSSLNGVLFIDNIQKLIAFNSDSNKNLVIWNINTGTNQQFMNGHITAGVINAQLDLQNNFVVSQGADFLIIVWNYLTLNQIYRIQDHAIANQALIQSQSSIPAAFQVQYQIILFSVDTINKVIVSANNLGTIFVHSYITFTSVSYNITSVTYVYVDNLYNHIIAASNYNFIYKLTILSYTSQDITYFKDVKSHTEQILGVLIQNKNVYSFEETKIIVMDRQTLTQKNTIVCVNPLITNFIVYEKLNQVIIWSDAQTSILNQSIGVYNLLTGAKIQDINNNQAIEQGNIHKVIVDEDTNQLIISKVYSQNYIYTIDLQTFYYTGYYCEFFVGFLKQWQYIPRTNRLIYIDSSVPSNFTIYSMGGSINLQNKFELISDEKNANTLVNWQSQNLYYFDSLNQSWKYDRSQQKLTYLNNNDQIKMTKLYQDFFYVITSSQALKYTSDLLLISSFNFQTYQCFFTNLYLYLLDFSYNFIQISLTSFSQLPFQRQLEGTIQQFLPNENYQDLIVMLVTQKIYRFNMVNGNTIYSNSLVSNLQMVVMDSVNQIIIYVIKPSTLNCYLYQQKVADYTQNLVQTLNNRFSVYNVTFDYLQSRLITITIYDTTPIISFYQYIFDQNTLKPLTLVAYIPSPTRNPNLKVGLSDPTTYIVYLPWQIIWYDRMTFKCTKYFRDTQILYSLISIGTVTNYPNLLNSVQKDSIQFYSSVNNIFQQPSLFKFPLSYPVVLSSSVNRKSIFYQAQILGISTSFIFDYTFQIPVDSTSSFNYCFQNINGTFKYMVDMQMMTLQNSINKLNFQLSSSLIQVDAQNALFYHSLMNSYQSSVVYQNYSSTPPTIKITNNFLNSIGQDQVILDNYILDISNGGQIQLNSNAKRLVFKSIQIIGNTNNFSFLFSNIDSVILENILINTLTLSGSSVLFNITGCSQVYIKNFRVRSLQLSTKAQLFYIKSIYQQLKIDNLSANYLSVDFQQQQNFIIGLINIVEAQIVNSRFSQFVATNSTKPFYFISSQGVQQLTIDNVIYKDSVALGFLQYKNYYQDNQQIVYLHNDVLEVKNSQFNSHFKLNSPFISVEGNSISFDKSQFQYIECKTCSGTVLSLISVQNTFQASLSLFNNTIGENGGAIAFLNNVNVILTILDSTFLNCTAVASGGALYLQSSDLMLNRTIIQNCVAQIGGGVRYIGLEPLFIYYQRKYSQQPTNQTYYTENNIKNNQASIYGQNVGSYPKMIKIISQTNLEQYTIQSTSDSDVYNLDYYLLNTFQSGADIDFQFQILDQDDNPIYFDISALNNGYYPDSIVQEIYKFNIKALPGNDNIKVFGQYITDYTQFNYISKEFSITQMLIIGQPASTNYILFESPSIQKVFNSDQDRNFNSGPFHIRLNIQFRKCLRGEVYKLSGSIFYCQECKEGTYSIVQPIQDDYDTQLCLRCPDEASYCYRDQMELKLGYWKYSNDTDKIVYCTNAPDNCNGDQKTNYCTQGHIGPQCEQCDIYGSMWVSEFQSDGKYGCINCTELRQPKYLMPTILIALGMVIYIVLSVHIAYQINTLIVQGYYLRQLNLLSINKSAYQDTTNMNIKAMVNYMQISSMVNTFVVKLPDWMTFIPEYFGSPIKNMLYTFDCYLNQAQESKYPIVFLRTLWSLGIPILYLLGAGFFYFILVQLRLIKYKKSYIISGLVFLCFFIQPNMVSDLLGVMSCREIDGKLYISTDISYECYTKIHLVYIGIICLPGLIVWGVVIPIFIIRLLVTNKDILDHATIRLKYGFLYQDYKNDRYFWEFIKMYKKLFAVAVLSFYGNPYIVYLLYLVALLRFKPYQMQYFQKIDRVSMIVAITILLMNIFLYNKPDQVQQQLFYVIILILHNAYQFFLILEVFRAKISIYYRVKYNAFLKWLVIKIPCLKPHIVINQRTSMKTFHLWMKITYYINEYAERKQYNEINQVNLLGSMSQSKEIHNQSFLPSKRNRMRMQNSNALQPNKNSQALQSMRLDSPKGGQEEFSQSRHSFHKDNMLSVDRLDPQFLSPKGSSNNLLILSGRRDETFKGNGNYYEFDDLLLSPTRNHMFQSPLSSHRIEQSELNNYGDIEEAEDDRRLQKKKGINYDYRLYQKTDLIKKNLQSVNKFAQDLEEKKQKLIKEEDQNKDTENLELNESQEVQEGIQVNQLRNTNTLAPRLQSSYIQAEEKQNITPNPTPNQENNNQLLDLNEDDEVENQLDLEPKDEEDEDTRRIRTKNQLNYVMDIQRKVNLIYKNLHKVQCSELISVQDQNVNDQQNENILETDEESSKPQDQNLVNNQKSLKNQSVDSISRLDSQMSKQIINDSQKDTNNLLQADQNAVIASPLIEPTSVRENSLSQNLLVPQKEIDLNMSKEIQNIIHKKAITTEKLIQDIQD